MAQVEDTPENFKICMDGNCSSCPSLPEGKDEGLYCARGKSKSEVRKKGCRCPECPVWLNGGLGGMYYCV
jgi:hypothetical protein